MLLRRYFEILKSDQYGNTYDMPDLTVELTDAEIDEHLGDLWITNLGRARYADMLKDNLITPNLMPKQYGYMLAKKLLRKVSFGTFSKIFKLVFEILVNYCVFTILLVCNYRKKIIFLFVHYFLKLLNFTNLHLAYCTSSFFF